MNSADLAQSVLFAGNNTEIQPVLPPNIYHLPAAYQMADNNNGNHLANDRNSHSYEHHNDHNHINHRNHTANHHPHPQYLSNNNNNNVYSMSNGNSINNNNLASITALASASLSDDSDGNLSASSTSFTPSPSPSPFHANLNNTYYHELDYHRHNYTYTKNGYKNHKQSSQHMLSNGGNTHSNNSMSLQGQNVYAEPHALHQQHMQSVLPLSLIYGFLKSCLNHANSTTARLQSQSQAHSLAYSQRANDLDDAKQMYDGDAFDDDLDDDLNENAWKHIQAHEDMDDDMDEEMEDEIGLRGMNALNIYSSSVLSSNILQLILLYFDDDKFETSAGGKQHGCFVWKMPTLELLTAKCIESRRFQIGSFVWYLSVWPYGIDDEHVNFTNLYLHLASSKNLLFSSPMAYREIILNARLYCMETKSCWSSIKVFKTDSDYHGWQKGALKITEVCDYKYLTFVLCINVLRVSTRLSQKSIVYQYPLTLKSSSFVIKWKIDDTLLSDLKKANEMKRFESDICYNMWVLGCVPNGIKKDNESTVFKIYLKLCALPPNISKIKVKFNILCIETKKHLKYIYNDFDYKHKYWQTDKLCKRSYLIFNDFDILRFKADIEIIEQYDLNNNELSSNAWKQHIERKTVPELITQYTPFDEQQLQVLVSGFLRRYFEQHKLYHFVQIVHGFYPKVHGDLFTWNISCEQILKLSQLNYKQRFDSKIFNISNLKWFLQIYPNGYRPEDEGFCSVYLILAYLPSILKEITIHFGVYCPQTMSNFSTIHTFNHSRDGRGTRRMLSLTHLRKIFDSAQQSVAGKNHHRNKAHFNKLITFNCYVNILRIKVKEKKIIYQYPLILRKNNLRNYTHCKFTWNIDKEMMLKFKQCNNGQRFESNIFYEMWNLSCFPNENKNGSDNENAGQAEDDASNNVVIGIRLCALPKDILKIKVKYKLSCVQFERDHLNIASTWTHTAVFDYDNYYVKSPKHTIQSSYLNRYDQLTFKAQIDIVDMVNLNGKTVNLSSR